MLRIPRTHPVIPAVLSPFSVPVVFSRARFLTPLLDIPLSFVLEYRTLCVTFLHLSLY